jgi:hypothetical protein
MLSLDDWDHTVPDANVSYPMRDDGEIDYFSLNDDDLFAIRDALEQDDAAFPTDLMVALIDRGFITT